ncbi:hypothetical protein [Pedobacter sp.]|uniref:hypothetical protein n=1 Tax=Pedobacter sp. TaxID=1411316 RepID=UPI003C473E1F
MIEIRFEPTDTELFAFNLYKNKYKIGEMLVRIFDCEIKVYYTFISPALIGQNYLNLLLEEMLRYSKSANLVICSYCDIVNEYLGASDDHFPLYYPHRNPRPMLRISTAQITEAKIIPLVKSMPLQRNKYT